MKAKKPVNNSKTEYIDISQRFKEVRAKNNLTQKEMGELVGLSAPAVGAIENGLYTPNFKVLRVLKKKFFVDYSFMIDGDAGEELKNLRQENLKLKKELDRLTKVIDKLVK